MTSRQAGHFFFEPKGYDAVNQATHEHKEEIKVGYNLRRKIVLHGDLGAVTGCAVARPDPVRPVSTPHRAAPSSCSTSAQIWLAVGIGGLLFRTVHLFFIKDVQTGLVWMTKIITDPFHDIKLYYKAPLYLLRGELIDPHARPPRRARSISFSTRRLMALLVSAGIGSTTSRRAASRAAAARIRSATAAKSASV